MDTPKHVKDPYLGWIASGAKTYEGRLYNKISEWDLYIGKRMSFYNGTKIVEVEITSLPTFPDFGIAYDTLVSKLIPNSNHREVVNMYNEIFHYENEELVDGVTSKLIKDKGVVAIGFKLLSVTYL